MQILEIVLKGYKRFSLNSIEYFKYTPKNKIQLILGTNGSGKSSLIKELSPLPAEQSEYTKDGFKIISYRHNNSTYVLKSMFSSNGNKFHFIKDNEELNPGFTVSVYRELVKKEFSITTEVHGLMTGRVKFSRMSVADRRKWFTQIADCDYTYAINFYTKLKDQARDLQGAVKLQQARLVQETNKLLSPEQEDKHREDIKQLNIFLDLLLADLNVDSDSSKQLDHYDHVQSVLINLSHELIKTQGLFKNDEYFKDEAAVKEAMVVCRSDIKTNETFLNSIYKDMESQSKSIILFEENNLDSFKDIDIQLIALRNESDLLKLSLTLPMVNITDSINPEKVSVALNAVKPQLDEFISQLLEHSGKGYDKTTYTLCLDELGSFTASKLSLTGLSQQLAKQISEYEHAKQHNKVDCPNCKHTWHRGFSQNLYDDCVQSKHSCDKKLEVVETKIKTLEIIKQEHYEYLTTVGNLLKTMSYVTILEPFWNCIVKSGLIKTDPKAVRRMLQTYQTELGYQQRIGLLSEKIAELERLKEINKTNQTTNLAVLKLRHIELEKQAQIYQYEIRQNKLKEQLILTYEKAIGKVNDISKELESLINVSSELKTGIFKSMRQDYISACIRLCKIEIAEKNQTISRVDIQKALITNIETELKSYQEQIDVYKIMLRELSPSEGLIAKGLVNFINHFVLQMNNFIKKIWLYPLEIQPVFQTDDDLELGYKFQVKVNDNNDIADVSMGSSAMREVIDLAFVIVSMQYLNLEKAPLFLDEFSVNLDSAHRQSAFNTITNLMTNSNHSQVFMISHYEDSYGSIRNADVTVLCPSNVVIPKDCVYNNCVVLS
jgi:energy-coupling factor transporter ATP-binding protein EcfA2